MPAAFRLGLTTVTFQYTEQFVFRIAAYCMTADETDRLTPGSLARVESAEHSMPHATYF